MDTSVAPVPQATLQELPFAELIDYYAEHNPDHSFNVFPGAADGDALSRISFLEFGRAAQRFARAIYPDAPVKKREVVGLLVNADSIMWTAALAGLIRAGVTVSSPPPPFAASYSGLPQVFPISPRNSPAAICHVLRTVSAHRLIVTESSFRSLLDDVKAELAASDYSLQIQELPTMDIIYPHLAQETTKHAFEAIALPPRSDNSDEVVLYIHSSGSTGFPKSIPLKQEIFSKFIFDPMFGALGDWKEPFCEW
jgi:acyl-CoA synthetase (AMP-forming)/AMP-acid ligase II